MKQFKLSGIALKTLALAGLLTACNSDQLPAPIENTNPVVNNQKLSALTRLVKDGGITLQYVKSGKFFGRLSRVDEYGGYSIYTYDDNNPAGNLWITKKWYKTNGNVLGYEHKFLVVNGRCVSSTSTNFATQDVYNYTYTYNAQGQLEEAKLSNGNAYKYSYKYNATTNSYQLDKLISIFGGKPNN